MIVEKAYGIRGKKKKKVEYKMKEQIIIIIRSPIINMFLFSSVCMSPVFDKYKIKIN